MRPLRPLVLVAVLALAASACGAARPPAAVVDGERITDAQLAQDEVLFTFLSGLSRQSCGQPVTGETPQSACARFTLANLIQEDLVKHYAAANHIAVPDAKVTSAISQLQTSLGGADKLDVQLKASGLTRDELTALARRLLLFGEVQGAIGETSVTGAQLQQLYEQQKLNFTQLHAMHILVKTKAEAVRLEKRVTPANFGELAKKYSVDTGSAQSGGDLGTLAASGLDPTFVQAAMALKPGQISRPVHTQFGWHIIELVSVTVQPFDQVKAQLVGSLAGQAFSSWLREQLAHAKITVNPKYGRLDTATGEVVPITSTATGSPAAASPSPSATQPAAASPSP